MRTNTKGDIGELIAMTRLLQLDYWVSKPFGDDCPYDILIDDKNGKIKRVQVKYVTPRNNLLRCNLLSNTGVEYKNTVDWILLVNSLDHKIYKVQVEEFHNVTSIHLRLDNPKNNQNIGIHLAENFVF